jgi:hypothetical protein
MIGLTTEIPRGVVKIPACICASRGILKNSCAVQISVAANKVLDLGGFRVQAFRTSGAAGIESSPRPTTHFLFRAAGVVSANRIPLSLD